MITAQDIREKTFEKARFSGYDMASVDDFLEELAEDVSATQKENAVLKSVKRKPILPSEEEIKTNPRSRSAKLRVAERV